MAIQSDETLVTKGDLKTLYTEKILPYLGGNMMMQTGVSDYYSEDEKVVGVWTDGKPLYQKTVTGNLPTSSTGDNTIIWQNFTTNGYEFHGGEGTLNWTSGRVAVPWSGGENNKACLNIYQGNLVIYWAAAHFSGGAYIINVRYTKTTDTASSTLTTPGCYDINRPDLWPNNKEIFFGNGLYGYKSTGVASSTSMKINAGITPVPTRIINHEVTIYGTNQTPVSSGYWTTNNFISGVYLSPQGEVCFALCSDYVNKNYTVWVLYNK